MAIIDEYIPSPFQIDISKPTGVENKERLFVLEVDFGDPKDKNPVRFSFPINPEEVSIDQQNRVGVIFTYGEKVFQNLGRGLKTINISGHTGFRVMTPENNVSSSLASWVQEDWKYGKRSYLDLYSLVQAIKGENIFGLKSADFKEKYSPENMNKVKKVRLIDSHNFIAYEVILRSDKFFRSKAQPNLYRYNLSFIVEGESIDIPIRDSNSPMAPQLNFLQAARNISKNLQETKKIVSSVIRGVNESLSNYFDATIGVADDIISLGTSVTEGITAIETNVLSRIDSVTRLDSLLILIKSMTQMVNAANILQQKIKEIGNGEAFFELQVNIKNLKQSLNGACNQTQSFYNEEKFRRDLTSLENQGNIQVDKDAWARFSSDVFGLRNSLFNLPNMDIKKIDSNNLFLYGKDKRDMAYSTTSFNKFFSDAYAITFDEPLSNYNIKVFNAYLSTDFERKDNVIIKQSETYYLLVVPRNYAGKLNFEIQFSSVEQFLNSSSFKSIRKIKIKEGDTIENLIDSYAKEENETFKNYKSIIASLNGIEDPYIITYYPLWTSTPQQITDYIGSFALFQHDYVINTIGRDEFIQNYKYNFAPNDTGATAVLPLFSGTTNSEGYTTDLPDFKLKQDNIVGVLNNRRFFVVLLKDVYSENLYALFGVTAEGNNDTGTTILGSNIEYYFISAIEKGTTYNIVQDTIFEILNPYNLTLEILDRYAGLERFRADEETDFWTKCMTSIRNIYLEYVSEFASLSFAWTEADKVFFIGGTNTVNVGDIDERKSAMFTNFYYDTNDLTSVQTKYTYTMISERKYKVLVNGDYLLLPSLSESFLSFEDVLYRDDVYKIDMNQDFVKYEIFDVDVTRTSSQSYVYSIDFPLIRGIPNVKQAIVNRIDCPVDGLKLHRDYGMPDLLGKKNSLENLTLLRYYLYGQLNLENRVKSVDSMKVEIRESTPDSIVANTNITLVNNDEIIVRI